MFRPRHAYRSPITNRYRGKAKGCPVFNTLADIDYLLVEQHDECLECLLKINNHHNGSHSTTTTTTSPPTTTTTTTNNHQHHHNNHNHHHHHHHQQQQHNQHHDTSSTKSWSSSYNSPPSPMSTSSISSTGTSSSSTTSLSSSPISSPDIVNELRKPRLKISEQKIRKIKKRPISFDDHYYSSKHSLASTPTTSSGCSPGQHSNTTQCSDQSRLSGTSEITVIHTFQAPAKFVNNLKPCKLPTKPQELTTKPSKTPPVSSKEMLNCAICGIKDSNISKIYGQNSCLLCSRFFASFLKRPQQLYCAQDGDCLMTFDSRCQACWIKICLQKFDIEDEHRKIGQKYSPKLLSSPKVSLITIDTSLSR